MKNLSEIQLSGAHLRQAYFVRTVLCSANLNLADLRIAQLFRADLSHASLHGANLNGANLVNVENSCNPAFLLSLSVVSRCGN
jgi:uncharacterized protein YjbI with pentapeptide repeats